jgi:hypothetical protein
MTEPRFSISNLGRVLLTSLFFAALAVISNAQSATANNPIADPTQLRTRFPDKTVTIDQQNDTQDIRRMHLLNTARQKTLVNDAEKLLALARQLNAGMGADGSALSASQRMRMAADIEKLAHSIKEKMSYTEGSPTAPKAPITAWQ